MATEPPTYGDFFVFFSLQWLNLYNVKGEIPFDSFAVVYGLAGIYSADLNPQLNVWTNNHVVLFGTAALQKFQRFHGQFAVTSCVHNNFVQNCFVPSDNVTVIMITMLPWLNWSSLSR